MTQLETDILIVGAGPAGSTFARELPKHLKAILLDKKKLDTPVLFPDKTCGGLLAPDAQECLLHMKLSVPNGILSTPQLFGVRAVDLESGHSRYFQRHYTNLARDKFDRWLFTLACQQSNITPLLGQRFVSCTETDNGIIATLDNTIQIKCKLIVGADGAHSRLRQHYKNNYFIPARPEPNKSTQLVKGTYNKIQQWYAPQRSLAVQAWFKTAVKPTEFGSFFHTKVTHQYAWSIPKGDFLIVGTTMPWPRPNTCTVKQRMNILLQALNQYGYELGSAEHTESCALLTPGLTTPFLLGTSRIVLIGEAAGLVSPSSAEGISYAFKSAMTLADVLKKNIAYAQNWHEINPLYRKQLRPLLWNLRCKWIKATAIYLPCLRRPILASGLGSSSAFW